MEDFGKKPTELTMEKCQYGLPHDWMQTREFGGVPIDDPGFIHVTKQFRCRRCEMKKITEERKPITKDNPWG